MIFKEMPNTNPMALCGMATKLDSEVLKIPENPYDPSFCYCDFECEEIIPVWGGGSLDWQNDKSTFAFIKTLPNDTFAFSIWKDGVNVASITDNTYGDYIPTYTDNPKQYSFVLDWNLVFQAFGYGIYEVKNNYTSLLTPDEYVSSKYELCQYSDEIADGYIKLSWLQDGSIQNNDFKFCTPLLFTAKFKGEFKIQAPETKKDSYQSSTREIKQFRNEINNRYLLNSKLINNNLLNLLLTNSFHAEEIEITDFNLFGSNFREKSISYVEVSELEDHSNNRRFNVGVQFEDYKQDNIKDNCC